MASVVCNASPLILLSRIERLDLLEAFADTIVVPEAVMAEVRAGSHRDDAAARTRGLRGLRIVSDTQVPERLMHWELGPGETQVLALAIGGAGEQVMLDDHAARRCAVVLSIPVTGTVGLVAWARRREILTSARSVLFALCTEGLRTTPTLIAQVLAELGEEH